MPTEHGEPTHYMALSEARKEAFIDKHQPSALAKEAKRENACNPNQQPVGRPRKEFHPRGQEMSGLATGNELVKRNLVRGLVPCADCFKSRVIYSAIAPSRMLPHVLDGHVPTPQEVHACQTMAKQVLSYACASTMYVCGATALDPEHEFANVFVTKSSLTCADHIEHFFYTAPASSRQHLINKLCYFCALEEGDQ